MNNTDKVFNYLLTNKDYSFTVNQLVGQLNLTSNSITECLNILVKQNKVKLFNVQDKQFFKLK